MSAKTHGNASETLADIATSLQDQMDHKGAKATVVIGKNKMQTINEYAFLFATNLNAIIIEYNLTRRDIMVVLKLIEYMYFGNLLSFSNSKLAKDLNLDPSNVSKVMKKLKHTELIIEDEGNLYFNPHIACKGTLDERIPECSRLLDYSAVVLNEMNSPATVSILTNNLRRKRKDEAKTSKDEINNKIKDFFS